MHAYQQFAGALAYCATMSYRHEVAWHFPRQPSDASCAVPPSHADRVGAEASVLLRYITLYKPGAAP